ncbi:DUF2961 domain-containing protein [Prolixibacteraceae bacterium JC049]|nr:DUF2961 domain-containing protein [Prolixibacteraceae bacterium JC049]
MRKVGLLLVTLIVIGSACKQKNENVDVQALAKCYYKAAPEGVETRWVSAENPDGLKGKGALTNKGAKGDAYYLIAPGEKKVIFNQQGAGMITKIWSANSALWDPEMRRQVKIEMYWDNANKPAVSVPFSDFFGVGLGLMRKFECELFSSPEGRSHNCFIPMPYRKAAKIEIVNESEKILMFYFKVDFLKVKSHPEDVMYFHTYWHRDMNTKLGEDFEILPNVNGRGRYLGTNIGVIGNPLYQGSWFGEGEVKIFLDGDSEHPTLVGTGTEDYIGSGWGQNEFANDIQGSLVSDKKNDLYAFYRYHTVDPVYFHKNCKVTIQQMGNAHRNRLREMRKNGAELKVLWSYVSKDGMNASKRYLDMENPPKIEEDRFPDGVSTTFYRRDDVSATAYFYLDKPSNELPAIQNKDIRTKDMKEKVFKHTR